MSTLALIVIFTALGGVLSVICAGLFLLIPDGPRARVLPHLVSFATGALLGAALLALLPDALDNAGEHGVHGVGLALVCGIVVFFVLEKLVLWRHSHSAEYADHGAHHAHHEHREQASAVLVIIGDSIHNALDGVIIGAAFLSDIELGIVTAVAVMAHEIPQEIGDFAVLLHSRMSRARALSFNLMSSLTSVIGGLVAYFTLGSALRILPYAIAVAAASFIYVAMADLIPGLHRRISARESIAQVVLISLGIAVIALVEQRAHG
ncbi:MAG TPA: ZIP family metal transporter [Steroidobacteraceae bacterium]|nr:ZIP family metal transporter [Steroidobacteraceae bacterium]